MYEDYQSPEAEFDQAAREAAAERDYLYRHLEIEHAVGYRITDPVTTHRRDHRLGEWSHKHSS